MIFAVYSGYSGDNMTHLAFITRLVGSGQVNFSEPILGTGFVEGRTMFHLATFLFALVPEIGRTLPGPALLVHCSPLLALTAIMAVYSLVHGLTSDRNAALFGTSLFMLYLLVPQDYPHGLFYQFSISDKTIGIFIFVPCTVVLAWEYLSLPRPRSLILLCIAALALGIIHPVVFVMCWFLIAGFVLVHHGISVLRGGRISLVPVLLLVIPCLVGLAFPLYLRTQFHSTSAANLSLDSTNILVQHRLKLQQDRLIVYPDGHFIGDPALILGKPVRILAYLLLPIIALVAWRRKDAMAQFLLAGLVFPALLLFNPVTPELVGRLVTPMMVFRFSWLFPDILAVAFVFYWLVGSILEYLPQNRRYLFGSCALSLPVLVATILVLANNTGYYRTFGALTDRRPGERVLNRNGAEGVIDYLWDHGSRGSVVLASDDLNEEIPGLAGMYVVERGQARTANFFPPDRVSEAIKRIEAVELFEQAIFFDETITDIIADYEVSYIILPVQSLLVNQLDQLSAFELLYEDSKYSLYGVTEQFRLVPEANPDAAYWELVHQWSKDPRVATYLLPCLEEQAERLDPTMVRADVFALPARVLPVLFEHPPIGVQCPALTIPADAVLEFSLALSPEVWTFGKGDGVRFEIYLEDGDGTHLLFSEYLDPKNAGSVRRWHPRSVDLSGWAGHTVSLTFSTDPGPAGDAHYDWAGWGEPRIIAAGQP
jgi:hypothetical protein